MNKFLITCILSLVSLSVAAQVSKPIKGCVVDSDTKEPLEDVVIKYGQGGEEYLFTDQKGNFEIKSYRDSVLVVQSIGYITTEVKYADLVVNPIIELESSPISLAPVVINPYLAEMLLAKAMDGTRKHILVDKPVSYLLSFLQVEDYDRDRRNRVYLEYTSTLKKKDLKKSKKDGNLPYTLRLVDVFHLEQTPLALSDLFGAEYHASHLLSFGKSENNVTTLSYSVDTTQIILNIRPIPGKSGWAEGEVVIDKKDMAILKIEVQSVDSLLAEQPYKKYREKQVKIVRKKGIYQFEKMGDKYHMNNCFTLYKFRSLEGANRYDDFTYTCEVKALGLYDKKKPERRILSGYCQELFYLPNSTTHIFWQ